MINCIISIWVVVWICSAVRVDTEKKQYLSEKELPTQSSLHINSRQQLSDYIDTNYSTNPLIKEEKSKYHGPTSSHKETVDYQVEKKNKLSNESNHMWARLKYRCK